MSDTQASLQPLARLVVRSGVGIGGLSAADRDAALALCAAALGDGMHTEAQANDALRRWLDGPARWLDVDHVELRRWLVDRGLWQRDGFGLAYRRTPTPVLDAALRPWVDALAALDDVGAWVDAQRAFERQRRAQRRAAWQARAAEAG